MEQRNSWTGTGYVEEPANIAQDSAVTLATNALRRVEAINACLVEMLGEVSLDGGSKEPEPQGLLELQRHTLRGLEHASDRFDRLQKLIGKL